MVMRDGPISLRAWFDGGVLRHVARGIAEFAATLNPPDARERRAVIKIGQCLAHTGGFCSVCVEHCPVSGAITIEHGKPRIVDAVCTGCGECHRVCPAPRNAVLLMRDRI